MPGLGFARHTPGPGREELSAPRCQHQCRGPRSAALLPSLETLFPPARKCGWAQQWTAGAGGAGTASASFLSRPPVSRAVPCAAPCQAWPSPFTACGLWRDPSGGVGSRSDWEIWPAASRGDSLTPRASRGRFAFPLPRQLSGLQGEDENPLKEAGKSGLRSPPNSFCIFFSMCHHVLENHCQGDKTSADSKAASDRRGLCVPAWFQPLVWQLLECVHRLSGDRPAHDSARRPARRPLLARPRGACVGHRGRCARAVPRGRRSPSPLVSQWPARRSSICPAWACHPGLLQVPPLEGAPVRPVPPRALTSAVQVQTAVRAPASAGVASAILHVAPWKLGSSAVGRAGKVLDAVTLRPEPAALPASLGSSRQAQHDQLARGVALPAEGAAACVRLLTAAAVCTLSSW